MPINKLALVRYKTIDNCLQNHFKKWTLEDLMEACSSALNEYEGISRGISRRTIQMDLQNMRSEKLGYNAPIVVSDKKYYSYGEKNYSITNTPVTKQDLGTLNEVIDVLKQFKGFGYFNELSEVVTKLEDRVYKQQNKGRSYIDFEKNELLKGLDHVDALHKHIIQKKVLDMSYQSFKAKTPNNFIFHPYLLKEHRNRWFILGMKKRGGQLMNLALDRIESFVIAEKEKYVEPQFEMSEYFSDVIGVTKMPNQRPQLVVFKINAENAPYVITKPFHSSQRIMKSDEEGTIFSIKVILNFELERDLLGFGDFLTVLSPRSLRSRMMMKIKNSLENYGLKMRTEDSSGL